MNAVQMFDANVGAVLTLAGKGPRMYLLVRAAKRRSVGGHIGRGPPTRLAHPLNARYGFVPEA